MCVRTYTCTDTRKNARPCSAGLHVREVTHVGGYLRYLWAIFPIQLLLSKPLPVQHVRNKKLDKIISTSRHGFDSLKLVKSYGAGIRGILFYFLSLHALSLSLSLSLIFFVSSLFLPMPFFCYPSVETPDGRLGIDPPRAHKSAIFIHIEGLSRFLFTISEGSVFDLIWKLFSYSEKERERERERECVCCLCILISAQLENLCYFTQVSQMIQTFALISHKMNIRK